MPLCRLAATLVAVRRAAVALICDLLVVLASRRVCNKQLLARPAASCCLLLPCWAPLNCGRRR